MFDFSFLEVVRVLFAITTKLVIMGRSVILYEFLGLLAFPEHPRGAFEAHHVEAKVDTLLDVLVR